MGKRNKKRRNTRLGPQNPAARAAGAGFSFDDLDEPVPMTYQGRVITAEVIEEMRAARPEDAWQLDAEWERMVLANNRPWIADHQRRQDHEDTWAWARAQAPGAFADCGCGHPDDDEGEQEPRLPEELRAELWKLLAPTVPTGRLLDPVEVLLQVDGLNSIEDLEAATPDQWRIDGRPLTTEEMRAVLDMERTDFMRFHLIQDERAER